MKAPLSLVVMVNGPTVRLSSLAMLNSQHSTTKSVVINLLKHLDKVHTLIEDRRLLGLTTAINEKGLRFLIYSLSSLASLY